MAKPKERPRLAPEDDPDGLEPLPAAPPRRDGRSLTIDGTDKPGWADRCKAWFAEWQRRQKAKSRHERELRKWLENHGDNSPAMRDKPRKPPARQINV